MHSRHSSLWKWGIFVVLLGASAFLLFYKPPRPDVKIELLPISESHPEWDGSYPYLIVDVTGSGTAHVQVKSSVQVVKPTVRHDAPVNQFEVDLHSGMFVLRQTDLFVPDVLPLSLTRTYRVWDSHSRAFGIGANHPYDIAPTGTQNPYTYMGINLEDGRPMRFRRISKGGGYADAVFRHDETSSEFYDARVVWNGNGWTLTFADGRRFLFPDSYHATRLAQGAPYEICDGNNHCIHLKRDQRRNLAQLTSPSGRTITFKYDSAGRIVEAADDAGNIRRYSYDASGHLESVADGSHVLYRFDYEPILHDPGYDPYLITQIRDGAGKVLLQNSYADRSRVSEQRLANGEVYHYDYLFRYDKNRRQSDIVETIVRGPNGERKFLFEQGILSHQK